MRLWFKWLCIPAAILLLPAASAYGIDKLWLASGLASHTAATRELPLFAPSREGLVRIRASGMEFRARIAGFDNPSGEGVILLHGFPETSIMWTPLIERLAKAGYRVVAFDQRGYSPGARPFRVRPIAPAGSHQTSWRLPAPSASNASTSSATISAARSPGSSPTASRKRC